MHVKFGYHSKILKFVCQSSLTTTKTNQIESAAKDKIELLHLKFLKWTLGVHKKASNTFCYGDTGRTPNCLIAKDFAEQQNKNFDWFNT